jgi:hypothetical protein
MIRKSGNRFSEKIMLKQKDLTSQGEFQQNSADPSGRVDLVMIGNWVYMPGRNN